MSRVFVSYSSKDRAWCKSLVAALQPYDVDLWFDQQGLYVGDEWVTKIEQEIANCDAVLVALSPDALKSDWVTREVSLALTLKKTIIGIITRKVQLGGFISLYQVIDATAYNGSRAADLVVNALALRRRDQSLSQNFQPSKEFWQSIASQALGTWVAVGGESWSMGINGAQLGTNVRGDYSGVDLQGGYIDCPKNLAPVRVEVRASSWLCLIYFDILARTIRGSFGTNYFDPQGRHDPTVPIKARAGHHAMFRFEVEFDGERVMALTGTLEVQTWEDKSNWIRDKVEWGSKRTLTSRLVKR